MSLIIISIAFMLTVLLDLFFLQFWCYIFSKKLTISLGISHLLLQLFKLFFFSLFFYFNFQGALYLLLPFAQDHFYFQFEGSWLHRVYKLELQISMRVDLWLKILKRLFPHPEFKLPCLAIFFFLIFFFCLYCVSVAAWVFSTCSEWRLLSNCGAMASQCGAFSCWGRWSSRHTGFSSRGSWA